MPGKLKADSKDDSFEGSQLVAFGGRFDNVEGAPVTVTASGDTTIVTPSSGKKLRLRWLGVYAGDSGSEVVLTAKWSNGTELFKFPVLVPFVWSKTTCREAPAADLSLVVNLSGARTVYVNYEKEDFER